MFDPEDTLELYYRSTAYSLQFPLAERQQLAMDLQDAIDQLPHHELPLPCGKTVTSLDASGLWYWLVVETSLEQRPCRDR